MQKKSSLTLLALTIAGFSSVSFADEVQENQAQAKGLLEDATLTLQLRNWYHDRDFKKKSIEKDWREWTQNAELQFSSGYTPGIVGFGFDAFGFEGVKLNEKHSPGDQGIPVKSNGEVKKQWGNGGGVLKGRISQTVLKYGNQRPELPVVHYDDSRTSDEDITGFLLTSAELDGLDLNVGKFTQTSGMQSTKHDAFGLDELIIAGAKYQIDDSLSVSLYGSRVESSDDEKYNRQYANINYSFDFSPIDNLELDFNIYQTKYKKDSDDYKNGDKNTIWAVAPTYTTGAHSVMLAYQQNSGDVGFAWEAEGGGAYYMPNSVFSDYNNHKEKSYHVRYGLNFDTLGAPGLGFNIGYVYGDNIENGGKKDLSESDFYTVLSYTVPSGFFKDLSLSWTHIRWRGNKEVLGGDDDSGVWNDGPKSLVDNRIKIEYPIVLL